MPTPQKRVSNRIEQNNMFLQIIIVNNLITNIARQNSTIDYKYVISGL